MVNNKTNIVTISVFNLVLFLIISAIITFGNALAGGADLTTNTVTNDLLNNITIDMDNKIGDFNDTTELTRNDTLADQQDSGTFDKVEGIVNLVKGIGNVIGLILKSQFPVVSLRAVFLNPVTDVITRTIGGFFIMIWQLAIVYNWWKFIFGSAKVST